MKGKLIVLEGIDGSGKETQSNLLEKKLKEKGREVMHISFPDYESPSSALVKCTLKGTLEEIRKTSIPTPHPFSTRWIVLHPIA